MAKVILVLGDDVSTDSIYPGRYMATVLPSETPRFAFADLEAFNAELKSGAHAKGSVIVAGENFGCGSSREQAVSCLKGYDLVVVAKSFARIFLQNAVNLGLSCISCPEVEAMGGDELELSPTQALNLRTGRKSSLSPLPPARQAILEAGGLIPYTRRRLLEESGKRR